MPTFSHIDKSDIPSWEHRDRYLYRDNTREHRAVMAAIIGRPLLPTEIVHHDDNDGHHNDPDNLVVLSQSGHMKLHHARGDIKSRTKVPLAEYQCKRCGIAFYRKRSIKPTPQYCGHSCHSKVLRESGRLNGRLGTGVTPYEIHCSQCGAEITFDRKKGNSQKRFCNRSCAMKYTRRDGYNPRGDYDWSGILCSGCGKEFTPTRKQKTNLLHGSQLYCTKACFSQPKIYIDYECAGCKKLFQASATQRGDKKHGKAIYCSRRCYGQEMSRRSSKQCTTEKQGP